MSLSLRPGPVDSWMLSLLSEAPTVSSSFVSVCLSFFACLLYFLPLCPNSLKQWFFSGVPTMLRHLSDSGESSLKMCFQRQDPSQLLDQSFLTVSHFLRTSPFLCGSTSFCLCLLTSYIRIFTRSPLSCVHCSMKPAPFSMPHELCAQVLPPNCLPLGFTFSRRRIE